jgi:hypothetical protein
VIYGYGDTHFEEVAGPNLNRGGNAPGGQQ